jgi:hypothetical protein
MSSLNGHSTTRQLLNPQMLPPYNVTWIRNVNIQSGGILPLSYMCKQYALLALPLLYLALAASKNEGLIEEGMLVFLGVTSLVAFVVFLLIADIARHSSVIVSDNEIMFSSWLGTTTWQCEEVERCDTLDHVQLDRASALRGLSLGVGLVLNSLLAMTLLMNNYPFFWVVLAIMLMCVALLPAMYNDWAGSVTVEIALRNKPLRQSSTMHIRCRRGQARALANSLCRNRANRSDRVFASEAI